ncbi:MAG: hypothetical protein ACI4KA_09385 [Oscillospiraceae bacterium]
MKPRKTLLTAAAVTALFGAGGCTLNEVKCVYGPPDDSNYSSQYEASATSEASDFKPELNIEADVYGPPLMDMTEEISAEETTEHSDKTEESQTDALKGDTSEETVQPPETQEILSAEFNPADNIEVAVYGPPEWFE